MATRVKNQGATRRTTRISSKHQVTIPRDAFRDAGLRPGDRLEAIATGRGKIVLTRADGATERYAGSLTGVFPRGGLEELRNEWD